LPHDKFLTRLGARIKLFLHTLLACLVVIVTVLLLWMSVRLAMLT
jgi:hypothetical protein